MVKQVSGLETLGIFENNNRKPGISVSLFDHCLGDSPAQFQEGWKPSLTPDILSSQELDLLRENI